MTMPTLDLLHEQYDEQISRSQLTFLLTDDILGHPIRRQQDNISETVDMLRSMLKDHPDEWTATTAFLNTRGYTIEN